MIMSSLQIPLIHPKKSKEQHQKQQQAKEKDQVAKKRATTDEASDEAINNAYPKYKQRQLN